MDLLDTLKDLGGYWKYSGGKYLAKLTSGKVSDTYCNCGVLTCRPVDLMEAVANLLSQFTTTLPNADDFNPYRCDCGKWPLRGTCFNDLMYQDPDPDAIAIAAALVCSQWRRNAESLLDVENLYVCGPAMGGITLAFEVARQLGATAIFTEPVYEVDYSAKSMAAGQPMKSAVRKTGQQLKRFEIPEDATVLFVEDVITTGKSTQQMVDAVHRATGKDFGVPGGFLPYVLCLVNRSGWDEVLWASEDNRDDTGFKIISLADIRARTWETIGEARSEIFWGKEVPDADPSFTMEAVRPKDNWDLLTEGS